MERSKKVYVETEVHFDIDGRMVPRRLVWENGEAFSIDKVTDIRPAAAQKAGGFGDRYTVIISGQPRYLFYERSAEVDNLNPGRWFVERKNE